MDLNKRSFAGYLGGVASFIFCGALLSSHVIIGVGLGIFGCLCWLDAVGCVARIEREKVKPIQEAVVVPQESLETNGKI